MAEENQNKHLQTATESESGGADIKDRGVFDFLGKKKDDVDHQENKQPHPHQPDQEEVIVTEFDKVTVSEEEPAAAAAAAEKKKHSSILEKLHRSDSSSSSSSEEEGEDGDKKKKKKEKKKKEAEDNTSVPVEKIEIDNNVTEEKKGFLDKIKEKLPGGGHKKSTADQDQDQDHVNVNVNVTTTTTTTSTTPPPADDKKGILEKIKEKLPGYHPKTTTTTDEVVEHTNKDHD